MTMEERDTQILADRLAGSGWNELATKHGVSAQRCQQICIAAAKRGATTNEQIRYRPQGPRAA